MPRVATSPASSQKSSEDLVRRRRELVGPHREREEVRRGARFVSAFSLCRHVPKNFHRLGVEGGHHELPR